MIGFLWPISGGTDAGVSGVASYVAAQSGGAIRAFGYSPAGTTRDAKEFSRVFRSKTTAFTPRDPLQGWTNLIAAGVDPVHVRLVGFAGGRISRVEYAVALATGARVALVVSAVVTGNRRFNDPFWKDHPNLLIVPMDAMTIRAFLQTDGLELSEEDRVRFERAAQMAHADYVKSARPKDPSLQDWEQLPDSLNLSNWKNRKRISKNRRHIFDTAF